MRLSELVGTSDGGLVPVGPSHADPDVTSVVTMDLLDPRRYLVGGELVLTGLAWWRPNRPGRSREFVAALLDAGVAALAAGEAQLNVVPDDLVTACATSGVPLLRVPVEVSFATVIERANRLLSPPRPDDLAAGLGRHRALLAAATGAAGHRAAFASGAVRTAGLAGVLEWVGAALDVQCSVFSATGRLIGSTSPTPDESDRRDLARRFLSAARLPHPLARPGRRAVTLLGAGPAAARVASWVVAIEGDHRDWDGGRRGVVDELVSLVALERDLFERRSDVEHQLVAALGRASAADAVAAMSWCGLADTSASVVVAGIGRHAGVVLAESFVALAAPCALAEGDGGWLGVVAADEPADLVGQLRHVVGLLEPGLGAEPLRIGVSDAVTGGDAVLGAVAEARAVAAAGHPSSPHSVAGPDLLSSHALLLAAVPAQLRLAYRQRILGPLLEHDRAHRTDLVATLSAYLECSASWSRCAVQMHVHINTLRYRIGRIEALTGRDLRRLEDQADLLLALRLPV